MATRIRLMAAAVAVALVGCGALPAPDGEVVRYEYKRPDGRAFVRIERIERDAPPNDHPAVIGPDQMRTALASVRGAPQALGSDGPVFNADELDEIARPLASALAEATPTEDVTFVVLGSHGLFSEHSPATATTGRVFVRGGRLDIIFGLVQSSYEAIDISSAPARVLPGQRKARVEQGWALAAAGAQRVDRRGDWLQFDVASLGRLPKATQAAPVSETRPGAGSIAAPASQASPGTTPSPTEEARYADVAARLRILDRLHADKLISDDEYRERRRAILLSL